MTPPQGEEVTYPQPLSQQGPGCPIRIPALSRPAPTPTAPLLLQNRPWVPGPSSSATAQCAGPFMSLSVSADLGSSSVRAGLQSLEASGQLEGEFDMFALTRGSSLADQRKE